MDLINGKLKKEKGGVRRAVIPFTEKEHRTLSFWLSDLAFLSRAGQKVTDDVALELRRELVGKE